MKQASVREKTLWELLNAETDDSLDDDDKRKYVVEGHRRILTPWYNLLFALLGCTGLLIGNFNRRGQGKIITCSVVAMVIIQGADLSLTNLAGRSLYFLPILYANCLIPMIICIYLLLFYNPYMFSKRHVYQEAVYE